jgi:hypothetical protein
MERIDHLTKTAYLAGARKRWIQLLSHAAVRLRAKPPAA